MIEQLEARRLLANGPVGPEVVLPIGSDTVVEITAGPTNLLRSYDSIPTALQWFDRAGQPLSPAFTGHARNDFIASSQWAASDTQGVEVWTEDVNTPTGRQRQCLAQRFDLNGLVGERFEVFPYDERTNPKILDVAMHVDGRIFTLTTQLVAGSPTTTRLLLIVTQGQTSTLHDVLETNSAGTIETAYLSVSGDFAAVLWGQSGIRARTFDIGSAELSPEPLYPVLQVAALIPTTIKARDVAIGVDGTLAASIWDTSNRRPMLRTIQPDGALSPIVTVSKRAMDSYAILDLTVDPQGRVGYVFELGTGTTNADTYVRWYDRNAAPLGSEFLVHQAGLAGAQVPRFIRGSFESYDLGYITLSQALEGQVRLRSYADTATTPAPTIGLSIAFDNSIGSIFTAHFATLGLTNVAMPSLELTDFTLTGRTPAGNAVPVIGILYQNRITLMNQQTSFPPPLTEGFYTFRVDRMDIGDAFGNPLAQSLDLTLPVMRGDANSDGVVDMADMLIVAQHFGQVQNSANGNVDFSSDMRVDFNDLLTIAQRFGSSLTVGTAIPSPTSRRRSAIADAGLVS